MDLFREAVLLDAYLIVGVGTALSYSIDKEASSLTDIDIAIASVVQPFVLLLAQNDRVSECFCEPDAGSRLVVIGDHLSRKDL